MTVARQGSPILDPDLRSQPPTTAFAPLSEAMPPSTQPLAPRAEGPMDAICPSAPKAQAPTGIQAAPGPDPDLGPPQSTKKEPQFPAALSALIH